MGDRWPRDQTVSMTEFREKPGELIGDVERFGVTVTVTKNGKPIARIMPMDDAATIFATAKAARDAT